MISARGAVLITTDASRRTEITANALLSCVRQNSGAKTRSLSDGANVRWSDGWNPIWGATAA